MSPSCRIFILLLAAAAMGKPTTWQQGESPLTGVSTVSEQDLLAQPPGSNWTSYNGDYSGRRYSSLHEINLNNVAQLRTEEHTSELQSLRHLVCRLLLEQKIELSEE